MNSLFSDKNINFALITHKLFFVLFKPIIRANTAMVNSYFVYTQRIFVVYSKNNMQSFLSIKVLAKTQILPLRHLFVCTDRLVLQTRRLKEDHRITGLQ